MIRFAIIGFLAAIAAVVMAPSRANALTISYLYSCNIDGFIHMDVYHDGAHQFHFGTNIACGPYLQSANGDAIRLIVGEKTEIPASGELLLTRIERGPAVVAKRARAGGGPVAGSGRTTTVYLAPDRVGPNLARLLTSVDPAWRRRTASPSQKR